MIVLREYLKIIQVIRDLVNCYVKVNRDKLDLNKKVSWSVVFVALKVNESFSVFDVNSACQVFMLLRFIFERIEFKRINISFFSN